MKKVMAYICLAAFLFGTMEVALKTAGDSLDSIQLTFLRFLIRLLLDESTNDIDVNTLRALEEGLENFAGCAVVISHDRWFLDRICTHILSFEGNSEVVFYEGSYSDYEEYKRRQVGFTEPKRIRYRQLVK